MIRVLPAPEPVAFDANVRQPGLRAIAEMVGKHPPTARRAGRKFKKLASREGDIPADQFPAYWEAALDDLLNAYRGICAYSCFRIHPVTGARSADHFAAKSRAWQMVYEWTNYRLCSSRMNSRKREFSDVLDPFEVRDGWFQLELVGFQVLPKRSLPQARRDQVQATIDRLGLNDFRKQREEDAERYWSRDVSLRVLKLESPFVALELHRQGRLNVGDVW